MFLFSVILHARAPRGLCTQTFRPRKSDPPSEPSQIQVSQHSITGLGIPVNHLLSPAFVQIEQGNCSSRSYDSEPEIPREQSSLSTWCVVESLVKLPLGMSSYTCRHLPSSLHHPNSLNMFWCRGWLFMDTSVTKSFSPRCNSWLILFTASILYTNTLPNPPSPSLQSSHNWAMAAHRALWLNLRL